MVKAKDVMKKNVITASPDVSVSDAAKIMTNNKVGSVVIMKKETPIGIITDSDIVSVVASGKNPKTIKINNIQKRRKGFISADPDESVMNVTKSMLKNGIKRMPIIKNDKLLGMVSDKEILIVSPELINILSEKLKIRVDKVADPTRELSGICENCESYSDHLMNEGGRWLCENCK